MFYYKQISINPSLHTETKENTIIAKRKKSFQNPLTVRLLSILSSTFFYSFQGSSLSSYEYQGHCHIKVKVIATWKSRSKLHWSLERSCLYIKRY